jgi:hypothetical protein
VFKYTDLELEPTAAARVSPLIEDYSECIMPDQKESNRTTEEQKSGCFDEERLKGESTAERRKYSGEIMSLRHNQLNPEKI